MTILLTLSKQLQTRCSPKSFTDLVVIIPSLSTLAAYDVQVVIALKHAPPSSKESSKNKSRVIVSLYHGDYLPKELQVTSSTVFQGDQEAAFKSSLIVQVTFTGPALIDPRLQYGPASTQPVRDGDRVYEKLSFEEQAQIVNRLYHWVAKQVKEVPEMSLPWEPLGVELDEKDLQLLKLAAKAAKDKDAKVRASDIVLACSIM